MQHGAQTGVGMGVPAMDGVPPGQHPGVPGQMQDMGGVPMGGVPGMAPPEQQQVDGQMAHMGAPQMGGAQMGGPHVGTPQMAGAAPVYDGIV